MFATEHILLGAMKMKRQLLFLAPALFAMLLLLHSTFGESRPVPGAVVGTWSGKLSSRNFASFVVTIDIGADSKAHLVGDGSHCFTEADLVVTTSGSNTVTIAGRSKAGENITIKGTVDSGGKQLDVTYITNGSGSGRCETDQGAGMLDKQ
jgi:hypothetical protein